MGKFWKNGKRSQQRQWLLPSNEHRVFAAVVYKTPWGSSPHFVGRCYHSHFPEEEPEVTFLVGGKTILPDSDTRIRHRARGHPLGRSDSPCMCHVWVVVFSHRGGSLDL